MELWVVTREWYDELKVVAVATSEAEALQLKGELEKIYPNDYYDPDVFGPYKPNEINFSDFGADWANQV